MSNILISWWGQSENTIKNIGKGSHTVTVLEKQSSSYHFPPNTQGSHTDNILENVLFQIKRRGSNYELVVFLGCKLLPIPLSDIRH